MEGRRVSRQSQKYNPLFLLFLCLVVAVVALLVISVVMGARLKSANKRLDEAEKTIADLNTTIDQLESDLSATQARATGPVGSSAGAGANGTGGEAAGGETAPEGIDIDFTAHTEVSVQPNTLLDAYETYYTTAGVNLRSGPATSYKRITTLNYGTQVDVAAREGGWSFVRSGSNYGWVSSDYLTANNPTAR